MSDGYFMYGINEAKQSSVPILFRECPGALERLGGFD